MANFFTFVETQFHARIKCAITYNGKKFSMPEFYRKKDNTSMLLFIHTTEKWCG